MLLKSSRDLFNIKSQLDSIRTQTNRINER